ncbi:unnamed protein product (macronuclear) [Paramecium tetraurelia]|uniref:Uncharacterized protein n=1 Tax=Paramecium tetraurelia TaxID=5888 RepID=A0BWF6_PARTE|nr:uncharacterized protein GSPATT00032725001 [Paramecium tetraurelia]CAK62873.1 unnamed protein product [Paramecium tetraurelia]|eukprot:XP_001430271.1 hypothetical protein (macronuclear) [Paramecium tetraurelia strain d4-2]
MPNILMKKIITCYQKNYLKVMEAFQGHPWFQKPINLSLINYGPEIYILFLRKGLGYIRLTQQYFPQNISKLNTFKIGLRATKLFDVPIIKLRFYEQQNKLPFQKIYNLLVFLSEISPQNILGYLIMVNKSQNISLTAVKWTIYAIFNLFQKIDQSQFQKVEKCIWQLFINQCYDFPFIFRCLKNKVHFSKINKFVQLQYYLCKNLENKLLQLTEELFQQDEQLYEEWFRILKPSYVMLSIEYLRIKTSQQYYPKQMNIPLEDFNISLSEYSEQKQKQILENWIEDMTDAQKFKLTLPLLFNIIKRGESPKDVLILANKILQLNRQLADRIGCFNIKSVFQIFFNNANDELRLIIMKFFSKEFPIPFLYQNPILDKLKFKTELLLLNSNLFYFFDQGYTIINMSLSENQKKIGKTELINDIFYEREKFETSDTCQMNSNTIDIMFDFEFNNSRNFIVADVHGKIIFETLIKILPFFKFWIVQIDSSRELQENLDQLIKILQQIDQQSKYNFKICIIVRNTEEKDQINKPPSTLKIEGQDIQIYLYSQSSYANLNKQVIQNKLNLRCFQFFV